LYDRRVEGPSVVERKRVLRSEMRNLRSALPDREERSRTLWARIEARPDVLGASRILVFCSIPSEPDTTQFIEWCRANGKQTAVPEDEVDPSWPEVVIVPGLAFTPDGRRCGQGGGWYDRFLAELRDDCTTIGVCFAPQVVADLPTEPHDVVLDAVVTD
jgi:5-formyltetrahydrofolate cyclo-ligase